MALSPAFRGDFLLCESSNLVLAVSHYWRIIGDGDQGSSTNNALGNCFLLLLFDIYPTLRVCSTDSLFPSESVSTCQPCVYFGGQILYNRVKTTDTVSKTRRGRHECRRRRKRIDDALYKRRNQSQHFRSFCVGDAWQAKAWIGSRRETRSRG